MNTYFRTATFLLAALTTFPTFANVDDRNLDDKANYVCATYRQVVEAVLKEDSKRPGSALADAAVFGSVRAHVARFSKPSSTDTISESDHRRLTGILRDASQSADKVSFDPTEEPYSQPSSNSPSRVWFTYDYAAMGIVYGHSHAAKLRDEEAIFGS